MNSYKIGEYDLKTIQKEMLDIASEIDRICRKHEIKYILDAGTMLGAIRHKGFIPWDDDLDVAMLREDYDRFVEVCKTELDESFFLERCEVEADFPFDFAKMKKNGTVYVERTNKYRNIHQGIYVDIFPIDNINRKSYRIQTGFYSLIRRARWRKIYKRILPKEEWKAYKKSRITTIAVPLTVFSEKTLAKWDYKLMVMKNKKETPFVYKVCHPNKIKLPYPRSMHTDVIEVPFEDRRYFIPRDYDTFLRERYGDYMKLPAEEKRQPSHNIIEIKL